MSLDWLVLLAIALCAVSGVPGLLMTREKNTGQTAATALLGAGALLGLGAALAALSRGGTRGIALSWALPGGEASVGIDALSGFFLLPIFLIPALGSIYGHSYWRQTEHPDNGRKLRLCYGVMTAAMALQVVAHNTLLYLMGWEAMALSAYFLVTTEDDQAPVREAGWIYLVATHLSTLCLFAVVALLWTLTGQAAFVPLPPTAPAATVQAVFVLSLVGFGIKAGLMPLHVWLPGAHANAPSHVSAALSGVLIKMGIYGLLRVLSLCPAVPAAWGGTLLFLGAVSGVLGVAYAIGQHDIKRLLAYHSIENIGIIVMGLGLALLGRALGRLDWVVLGLAGALLHVLNHGLFKSLLFLGAGSVVHATHTREIDEMGGLLRPMPRTGACFLLGAVALCGLPPLNGFVSELFVYLGLFSAVQHGSGLAAVGAAGAIPALGLIGALALACFVKVCGVVFLGAPRSGQVRHAREAGWAMIGPMMVLGLCCLGIGLWPWAVAPALDRAVAVFAPEAARALVGRHLSLATFAPLSFISIMGGALCAAGLLFGLLLLLRLRRRPPVSAPTWDCGYAAPTARMQYTASSFAALLVGLFSFALRPRSELAGAGEHTLFPREARFHSHVPDVVLERAILPLFHSVAGAFGRLRFLQQGSIHAYLLYICACLVGLLLWASRGAGAGP